MATPQAQQDTDNGEVATPPAVIVRAQETAEKVMAWFPVRVFQRFSARNGHVLAAGASYQALFAIFAALYVAFAIVGVWLGGDDRAINRLIDLINGYLPGVIGEAGSGAVITREAVLDIASQSVTTLGVTGIVALLVVLWTAIGWIGSIRVTVRDIFGLVAERGNFVLLKARDLIAAAVFAVLLLVGAVLGWAGTTALSWIFSLLGWTDATWLDVVGRIVAICVMFLVDTVTLMMLYRFLTGTTLQSRDVLPGALLGGAAVAILQLAFGFLIGKTPSNPLLVTFAVLIGLLAWIRLVMTVILLSASWVAESAASKNIELEPLNDRERALRDATLLVDAATIELREAERKLESAGFWRRGRARIDLAHARNALAAREADLETLAPTPAEATLTRARLDKRA